MEKINLNKITAICIDGRPFNDERYKRYESIISFMTEHIDFYEIIFIGTRNPDIDNIKFVQIDEMGIQGYSNFCLLGLCDYINSQYCLIFQDDGFVLNPHLWRDEFLEYDYIGSPWPLYMGWPVEGNQVGNGGFSLRSKRLLEFSKTLVGHTTENEDTYLVGTNKCELDKRNLKIAPVEIARLFSVENNLDGDHNLNTCFGFHAKHLLPDALKIIIKESI